LSAELFEEEFHKQAPDIPLGSLKEKIKEYYRNDRRSNPFPKEVEEPIDLTNQSRIAAVHRGNVQLSLKESTDALRGTAKFTIWYYFKK